MSDKEQQWTSQSGSSDQAGKCHDASKLEQEQASLRPQGRKGVANRRPVSEEQYRKLKEEAERTIRPESEAAQQDESTKKEE